MIGQERTKKKLAVAVYNHYKRIEIQKASRGRHDIELTKANILLIGATNRADNLDPALLRPGRFDRRIVVPMPDVKGREEILNVHLKKVTMAKDLDIEKIAAMTPGMVGE